MDLKGLIAEARAAFEEIKPVTQDVLIGKAVVPVRLWPLLGRDWRELVATNPPREGSASDRGFGYNPDAVLRAYPRVALVTPDGEDNMKRVNEDGEVENLWPALFDELSGTDQQNLVFAMWGLNDYDPKNRLSEAGKASQGEKRKKRSSPAN